MSNLVPSDPMPGLISRNSINLIIGSPTSGRTVLALSEFERYLSSGEFFGYQLLAGQQPAQCAAITCGSLNALHERLKHMAFDRCADPVGFPTTNWEPKLDQEETLRDSLYRHYDQLSKCARQPIRFLFVENFQMMMMEKMRVGEIKDVYRFYEIVNGFLTGCGVALLGTVGQGKMKNGDSYPLLADRIYGSIGWAQGVGTLIGIQPYAFKLAQESRGSARTVTVAPSRSRTISYSADFTELGRLERVNQELTAEEGTAADKLDVFWDGVEQGVDYSRTEFIELGAGLGAKISSVDRWIRDRSDDFQGVMEKIGTNSKTRRFRKPFKN